MTNDRPQPGYKQTEVGVIPEDWEVKRLKQISPSQSVGLVINPSSYFDNEGSVPMLVGSQISENHINWEVANRISSVSNELLPASRLAAGDLVTVRVGNPGVTAVVTPELDRCNCASMMIVRQHSSFSSLWLCYVMNSRIGRSQIEHVQYGTAQKQFNISDAIDFIYPVPPLPEQRSISQALSDVDALIASLDKAIDKKRAIKTATMQQLLTGKKRLPGFGEGKGDRQTEVGVIPEDWDVSLLSELTSELGDGIHATPIYSNGEYYFVNGNNLFNGRITISLDTRKVGILEFRKYRKNLSNRSILMSINGTIGNLAYYRDEPIILGKSAAYLNIKKEFSKRFIYFSLQTESVEQFFRDGLTGTTIRNLGLVTIRNTPISIPRQYEEQRAIATVLSDIDAEIAALETRLAKTRSIKQGMMQQLLTGKVRLKIEAGMDAGREDD